MTLNHNRFFDPDEKIRPVAVELYLKVKDLPIVSPHGHVDPKILALNDPFPDPTELIIIPDHYVFRLLYSQGISLESLGIPTLDGSTVETDHRKIWQIFAEHFFLFIGTALFSFYHSSAAVLPSELMDLSKADRVFPYFIITQLPPGLAGLLIAGIFAAGMSTISTSYNSSATVFLTDYFQRYFKKSASDREAMIVLYTASVIISVLGVTIAVLMINVKSALDVWWKLASIFSGGMLGLFLLGVFSKSKNTVGAIFGVIAGILIILWMTASPMIFEESTANNFHSYLTIVFGTLAIFFTGFFISMIIKRNETDIKLNK